MRNIHFLVPILMLAMCHVAASPSSAPEGSKAPARSALKLKSVELDNKFTIQVPDYFTVHQISDRIAAAPTYSFSAAEPHYTTIQVSVLPYSSVIPINEKTRLFKLPIGVNGSPLLTAYFKIREDQYVYYGWSVSDQAYECTTNSPCPHPTPRQSRYMTQYAFAVFDKPNNSVVEFTGIVFGPSKKVAGFKGDGKLLRDVIVPSLTSIH